MSDENLDFTSKIVIWCSKNIKYIAFGAAIGISIPLSWNYHQYTQEKDNLVASELYNELIDLVKTEEEYKHIENILSLDYKNSIYEILSKFDISKEEFAINNYNIAKEYLEEIININANETYNSLAMIKISLINIEEKKYDEALIYIEKVGLKDAFKQVLFEIKGDIYKFKGDKENALKYYTEAIDSSAINNENLLMKKNSVKN